MRLGDTDTNGKQARSKSLVILLCPNGRGRLEGNGKAEMEFAESVPESQSQVWKDGFDVERE